MGLQWILTQCVEDLDYADNLCLLTHQLVDMQVKGERLQETGGQVGFRINIHKTKQMRIGMRQQESLELHGEAVERVSEFTYLGSIINETGGTDKDSHNSQDKESAINILNACACVEGKMCRIANKAQDFQYEHEVCPYVSFGNMEIDKTAD